MKTMLRYPDGLCVPHWCPHVFLSLLIAAVINGCGGSGGEPVTLNEGALGSATLSWTPPTQNTDGSPLADLIGYRIYFGNESGNYQEFIQIDNPGIATYVVEFLAPNTYYFAVTAMNSSGVESGFSNEASKQIL